jgi:hypothetical protein
LLVDHVDAVPAAVGHGGTEPERHDDDGDDPAGLRLRTPTIRQRRRQPAHRKIGGRLPRGVVSETTPPVIATGRPPVKLWAPLGAIVSRSPGRWCGRVWE